MPFQTFSGLALAAGVMFSALVSGGQSLLHPSQAIVAAVGEAVVLPCHLEPAADASDMVVEWGRTDLGPGFIHVWRNGKEAVESKQPSFEGRTSLSTRNLKLGDVSLKISAVRLSDGGTYRCLIPALGQESFVELIVGSVSQPSIEVVSDDAAELELECRCGGWYPEPELLWLDAEGNLLPAGPTETVRGSDDLYTVSSRVTVDKRHSSNITCRVQQTTTNQSRQTHMTLKYISILDSLNVHCYILITLVVGSGLVTFLCFWNNRRQKQTVSAKPHENGIEQHFTFAHLEKM